MEEIKLLNERIISRVNANLREFNFDTKLFVSKAIEYSKLSKFYCFYGITSHHPIHFNFKNSSMAGSYFLGKCYVSQSTIYKSDIRGDELKRKGDIMDKNNPLPLVDDETIVISNSLLYKTLVHSNSHNLETPEEFTIRNTVSAHYANIHGSTVAGCFLGAFSTVDLMNLHSCIVGEFAYIQAGEFFHKQINPGMIFVKNDLFSFRFQHSQKTLDTYIGVNEAFQPRGKIYHFVAEKENEYGRLFEVVNLDPVEAPESSAVNRYAVIKGNTKIGENVLISQRAYLDNAEMGDGSNAQENSYIVNSKLVGMNITAHGGKIINTEVGQKTFVGFNSFLSGKPDAKLTIGKKCIVMPHTIIDITRPLEIPDNHLVWGYIQSEKDLESNSLPFSQLEGEGKDLQIGDMHFSGSGTQFIQGFNNRIEVILKANGAYWDDQGSRGHAQDGQHIAFNTLQPYGSGKKMGLYPSIKIKP